MNVSKLLAVGTLLLLSGCHTISQAFEPSASLSTAKEPSQLRFDPLVTTGELSNGFRYYLVENTKPESRVYIRFVVNAGSMNEDDDQRGVAHIVEHMAFNGTKHFPENQLITQLEQAGMKFGVDINAFTDFENTVYTLNLPSNDRDTLDLALNIVSDWASNVTMLKGDLDAERGIVLEEWRARLGPMLRLGDKKSAIEMAGSRYVERDPIGDVETINTVSKYRVADFYHKWYRPDNMSIVVVGDINSQHVKKQLETKLGSQATPAHPIETVDYDIPLPQGWRSASVHEYGITTPAVELSFFSDFQSENSTLRYQQDLAAQVATRLLNVRLQAWEQKANNSVNSATFYSSNLGRNTTQTVFSLQLGQADYDQASKEIFRFLAQLKQHGFSQAEVEGEITRLKSLNDRNRDKPIYSVDLAGDLMVSAASGQLLLSNEDKHLLNQRFLNELNLEQVNTAFHDIIAPHSRLLLTTQPNKALTKTFTASQLDSLWNKTMASEQPQWKHDSVHASLPSLELTTGTVKLEKVWAKHKLTEYRLSNGSKLIYRYSNSNPGQVHFKALTSGGLRSVERSDYHTLRIASNLVDETGVGIVPQRDIQTIFRGNPVVMSTIMDDYQQGFSGWAKTDSLEKMFQLFHLKLADSPVSEKVLSKYQTEMDQRYSDAGLDGEDQFVRHVSSLRYPNYETIYSVDGQDIHRLTTQQLESTYQKHIANKTDYTYFIVGDISQREVEKLAAQYLASVTVHNQPRDPYYVNAYSPKMRVSVKNSNEPRAEVELYLTKTHSWRPDEAYYLELTGELVQEELRLKLREQASGVYSVTSWFWQNAKSAQAEGRIQFSCAPDRVDELLKLTHQVLDDIAKDGVNESVLLNKRAQRADQIDRFLRSDLGILAAMEQSYMLTEKPVLIEANKRANKAVTKRQVDNVAFPFLNQAQRFEAVLLPKEQE